MLYLKEGSLLQGGKYKIIRFISSGGFGCTYEAEHVMLGSRVAIKEFFVKDFCNRDEDSCSIHIATQSKHVLVSKLKQKFIEEARTLNNFNYPGIVHVQDVFEENGTAYFVMDFINGCSLLDLVEKRGPLPEKEAIDYILQICDALEYVHNHSRLHLDIKPANIMLDENKKIVLIDFGASKHYDDESGENTSTLLGVNTQGYAPVEQCTQSFTTFNPATDIYALGATFYKLLTGITPPHSVKLMSEDAVLKPLPSNISQNTAIAVMRAMALKRKDRPQSVAEFKSLLEGNIKKKDDGTIVDGSGSRNANNPQGNGGIGMNGDPESNRKVNNPQGIADPVIEKDNVLRPEKKKKSSKMPLVITAVFAVVAFGLFFLLRGGFSGGKEQDANKVITVGDVSFKMVYVEGGNFMMGSTDGYDSDADDDEKPAHPVSLSSFYIGETEVTQALWREVMGENPSEFKGNDFPVENVTWFECQMFIRKLNKMTGLNFSMPTEAQWEFAARGGKSSKNYKFSGNNSIDSVAWFSENSSDKSHHVSWMRPNELGIYDMSGNVAEWCSDWYESYTDENLTDPTGPKEGLFHVIKGGAWNDVYKACRPQFRNGYTGDYKSNFCGLRLVLNDAEKPYDTSSRLARVSVGKISEDDWEYEGELSGKKPNGYGTKTFDDGTVQAGEWKNGELSGNVVYYYADGSSYVGLYSDGDFNGYGRYINTDECKITGTWVNGELNGHGTMVWEDGDEFSCEFVDGNAEGFGTYYYNDGSKYSGNWSNNSMNGFGTYYNKDGEEVYSGEWKDGEPVDQ